MQALNTANQNSAALQQKLRAQSSVKVPQARLKRPESYKGRGSITSWVIHMENYTRSSSSEQAFFSTVSLIGGNAHEWWIVHSFTEKGKCITTWQSLNDALLKRFQRLNRTKVACNVETDKGCVIFQWIILANPSRYSKICEEEKIDRYTRALKPHVWKEMWTKD